MDINVVSFPEDKAKAIQIAHYLVGLEQNYPRSACNRGFLGRKPFHSQEKKRREIVARGSMSFFTAASRMTTRLAPGALATTTAGLIAFSERGTTRVSHQAVTTASRHIVTTTRSSVSKWQPQRALSSSSSKEAATTAAKKSVSFVEWYEGHLQASPILTKMVTGSILWSLGDAVAQVVPPAAGGTLDIKSFQYDWMRTGRAFLFGFALHAPTSHVHFNFLEWMTVRAGVTGMGIPVFKASMEQFV